MNSDRVFQIIEDIAAASSKKHKEAIIATRFRHDEFAHVLRAALDPRVTYGIAKLPIIPTGTRAFQFDENTWRLLERLARRELTGNAARDSLGEELANLTPSSAELLKRIITKDLRAGFSAGTVNRVIPGAIFSFDCMLAHPFEAKRIARYPVYVEPKLDGWRALAFVNLAAPTPTATFYTRNGNEITIVEHLKQPLIAALKGQYDTCLVVDGEIVSGSFNETASSLQKKTDQATDAVFVVFDILARHEWDSPDAKGYLPALAYEERLAARRDVFRIALAHHLAKPECLPEDVMAAPAYQVENEAGIHKLYAEWRDLGLEGAIVKLAEGRYRKDRDYGWMKLKAEESADVRITGAVEGTGKYAGTLGALIVDFNGVPVNVSGMSDKLRDEMWCEPPVGRLAEIVYHEVTPDGSLRHPRFKRFRDDKPLPGLC